MPNTKSRIYQQIDHTADIGIDVWGADLKDLFSHAAYALLDIVAGIDQIKPTVATSIEVEADDIEMLMVNWLNELIYRISVDDMLYARFDIGEVDSHHLSAVVYGERYDSRRHDMPIEIKAATYHEICVEQGQDQWHARVIFDV